MNPDGNACCLTPTVSFSNAPIIRIAKLNLASSALREPAPAADTVVVVVAACPAEDSTLDMLAVPPAVVVLVEAAVAAKSTLPTSVHSVRDVS